MDKYSGKSWSYFVTRKLDLTTKVTTLLSKLTTAGFIPKYFQCNNVGENIKGLSTMCEKFNMQIKITALYTPQKMGWWKENL